MSDIYNIWDWFTSLFGNIINIFWDSSNIKKLFLFFIPVLLFLLIELLFELSQKIFIILPNKDVNQSHIL